MPHSRENLNERPALLIAFGASTNTSRANHQFVSFACEYFNTTAVTSDSGNPAFSNAEIIKSSKFSNRLGWIFFPIYTILISIIKRNEFNVIIVNQQLVSILPAVISKYLLNKELYFLGSDIPEGKYRVTVSHQNSSFSITQLIVRANFTMAKIGYRVADKIVLSDDSNHLNNDNKIISAIGGVDCNFVSDIRAQKDQEEESSNVLRIVYVGNMYYHRGIDILFEALELSESNFEVRLAGPFPDPKGNAWKDGFASNLNPSFKKMVEKSESCTYIGIVSHERAIEEMLNADVGICILPFERDLPHLQYSYPIKIFEYMATETAIIATKTDATSKILHQDQLVNNNSSDIAKKIDYFHQNKDELNTVKYYNREAVREYCWDNIKKKIYKDF